MQNQRSSVVGQLLYKNSLDCVQKVFRNEGLVGFYRGLGPQLIVRTRPTNALRVLMNVFCAGCGPREGDQADRERLRSFARDGSGNRQD